MTGPKLTFYKNWVKVLYSSYKIITPECGCSHLGAACKVPISIIYNADNLAINESKSRMFFSSTDGIYITDLTSSPVLHIQLIG